VKAAVQDRHEPSPFRAVPRGDDPARNAIGFITKPAGKRKPRPTARSKATAPYPSTPYPRLCVLRMRPPGSEPPAPGIPPTPGS